MEETETVDISELHHAQKRMANLYQEAIHVSNKPIIKIVREELTEAREEVSAIKRELGMPHFSHLDKVWVH